MKKIIITALALFAIIAAHAQDFKSPVSYTDPPKYKAGEILVKFKDGAAFQAVRVNNHFKSGNGVIDQVFSKYQISVIEKLFPTAEPEKLKTNRFPNGEEKPVPQLYNIFLIKFSSGSDAKDVAGAIATSETVEWAEPNGEAYITESIPQSGNLTSDELSSYVKTNKKSGGNVVPNDPLFSQQWSIKAIKADSLWATTTGDTSQIIAILDTGVDWSHPDLKNKIWTNRLEIPGNGIDDDGNGYIDDVRGWDFVNQDNNPTDDNSHGTHCAGIAAAETDNGIGIAGVSWGAKIMPIKVFQSNGIGYFSQIAEGFWYAARNGATIFSNSWSSSGESLTIRTAMEYAYSKGLIVAAAGNMGYKTDWPCPPWPPTQPNFPACYNWVLGVEATDESGNNTWFTNFDPTGPIISDGRPYGSIYYNDEDYNYEMRAPGISMVSTVPNGQYRFYSGTSMACPLVAGAIALMKSQLPNLTNEEVFAKLIQTLKINKMQAGVLDILKCTFTNPPPDLYFIKIAISDTLPGDDKDGRPDAGETLDIHVTAKNAGGFGDNICAKIRFSEFEDRSVANILKDTCSLSNISAYARQTSFDALKIKIDENVVDMRIISFQLLLYQKGSADTVYQNLAITIEHGIEIKGTYSKLHLHPNAYYIVTDVAVIDSLIIDPGTVLIFHSSMYIAINRYIHAAGTPDSMITFKGTTDGYSWRGFVIGNYDNSLFDYCIFENGSAPYGEFLLGNPKVVTNCIFRFCTGRITTLCPNGIFEKNVITNNSGDFINGIVQIGDNLNSRMRYNILAENTGFFDFNRCMVGWFGSDTLMTVYNNVFINNSTYNFFSGTGLSFKYLKKNYFGSTDLKYIHSTISDFYKDPRCPIVNLNGILNAPPIEAHGVVWKVEINDQNAQDVPITLSNGPAKFSVFFNRPMDPEFMPFATFGVRFPYTQNCISDSARWSPDHKVWTAYKTIDLNTSDGENTVRVGYAKDLEHFEIPIERSRFKFVVQAASSQSVDFFATPGIGKVSLEWPLLDSSNILGYNLYRYKMAGSNPGDTLLINKVLLTDSTYIDYDVLADTTYHYMFTAVETDFSESDFSKVATATPFNAANGDANGDLAVNVLDITTIISYLLNQSPKPFLPDAADVNYDGNINILDVIGVVNLIKVGKSSMITAGSSAASANIWIEGKSVYLSSEGNLAGVQFELGIPDPSSVSLMSLVEGFEFAAINGKGGLTGLLYSLSGTIIPAGTIELFRIESILPENNPQTILSWKEVFGGDQKGAYVSIIPSKPVVKPEIANNFKAFPNPASGQCNIQFSVGSESMVNVSVYDQTGKLVRVLESATRIAGNHEITWNGTDDSGLSMPAGTYTCRMVQRPVDKTAKELMDQVKIVLVR